MKESSEVYAQFTLSKMKSALEDEPLTNTQVTKLHQVLIANEPHQKHSIDVRFVIHLLFRSYYVLFFAGRDRRRATIERNRAREELVNRTGVPKAINRLISFIIYCVVAFVLVSVAYTIKSMICIDLFADFHLSVWFFDLLK